MALFPPAIHSAAVDCTLLVLLFLKNVIKNAGFLFLTLGTVEQKIFSKCCLSIDSACWKYAPGYRRSGIKLDRNTFPFMMRSEQIPEQIIMALFPENITAELCSCYYHKGFHPYFYYNLYFQGVLTQPEQFTMG